MKRPTLRLVGITLAIVLVSSLMGLQLLQLCSCSNTVSDNPGLKSPLPKSLSIGSTGGWTHATMGSGTVAQESTTFQTLKTGTAAGSSAVRRIGLSGFNDGSLDSQWISWDYPLILSFNATRRTSDAEAQSFVQLKESIFIGQLAEKGFGIQIDNLTMTGESYGTSRGTVGLGTIKSGRTNYVEIRLVPHTAVEFYVNGSLAGTITAPEHIPSGDGAAPAQLLCSHANGATGGTSTSLEVGLIHITQGWT